MLYFYTGTDRKKARSEMNTSVVKVAGKKATVTRVTDANSVADLEEALRGSGMFGKRTIVLDGIFENEEMTAIILGALPALAKSEDVFFMLEEKPDAATRKTLEKYAEKSERFDAAKGKREGGEIFALASALRRDDKKAKKDLWVGYQRALLPRQGGAGATSPEAIHGVLFWGAKQALLSAKAGSPEHHRAAQLVAELAELPHEARRRGFELEYALERYILSAEGTERSRSINSSTPLTVNK